MKLNLFLPVIILIAIGCGSNDSKPDDQDKIDNSKVEKKEALTDNARNSNHIFNIKTAKIVFKYTGGMETGTETLYFDDYGGIAVLVVDKKSKYSITNQTTIWKDKKSTIIDHEKKIISNSPFRPKSTEPPALADTDEQTRKNIGYEKMADETIAGKPCEVWFNAKQNFKYSLWNKIGLKEVLGTSINKEATSVEEITEIPVSVMEIPKDYKQ